MTALTPAIKAIQSEFGSGTKITGTYLLDSVDYDKEFAVGYADWED